MQVASRTAQNSSPMIVATRSLWPQHGKDRVQYSWNSRNSFPVVFLNEIYGIQITQECSMGGVAHRPDVSVAAVKPRLHRPRKQLVKHVDHRGVLRACPAEAHLSVIVRMHVP